MAKVIEFYVPARFRKVVKWIPQQERGRVLVVLSSNSGCSKKRVSFQSVSAYWQSLLSALEGKATDCATSILLRISSRRSLAVS